MKIPKKISFEKILLVILILGFINILAAYIITSIIIGNGVKERCQIAQSKYKFDCVQSLILYLDDKTNDFKSRNSTIWALGQIGDKKALPVLEKYYVGETLFSSPQDKAISQYELKKAINLAKGGINLTHFVWKR